MSANLVCGQCGHANRTVSVFCTSCGARMVEPELRAAPRRPGGGRSLRTVFRLLVLLVLAAFVGGLAWPKDVPAVPADADLGARVAHQVRTLRRGAERRASAAEVFDQRAINSYLAWRLQETPAQDSGPGLGLTLERMHVTLDDPVCVFRVLSRLAGLRLSVVAEVRPVAADGRLRFEPGRAWVGHVPVPGPARPWVLRKMAPVFAELDDERFVAGRTDRLDLRPGQVRVEVR